MQNLDFIPYYTTIQGGRLDLSAVSAVNNDEELIAIRSTEDHIFYIADTNRFSRIISSLEANKDTPEGRQKLAHFYSMVYVTSKDAIGKYICAILGIRSWNARVYLEPMENSIRAIVTPFEPQEENSNQAEKGKQGLGDTIEQVLLGGLENSVIGDYCDTMPDTAESLCALKDAIEDYDILELYACLFGRFRDKLSPEEISDYRARYQEIFDKELYSFIEGMPEYDTKEEQ